LSNDHNILIKLELFRKREADERDASNLATWEWLKEFHYMMAERYADALWSIEESLDVQHTGSEGSVSAKLRTPTLPHQDRTRGDRKADVLPRGDGQISDQIMAQTAVTEAIR
jgi:hypothetical protein